MRTTLITLILLLSLCVNAQEIKWQEETKRIYIFEITTAEAEKFVKFTPKDSTLIKKMLHTPRGSFVEKWDEKLQLGYYIFVNIDNEIGNWQEELQRGHYIYVIISNETGTVNYWYARGIPFQIFVFHEYNALSFQVVDANGKVRDDAKVFFKKPGFRCCWAFQNSG